MRYGLTQWTLVLVLVLVLFGVQGACGCSGAQPATRTSDVAVPRSPMSALGPAAEITADEWRRARARLRELRLRRPTRPYVERVRLSLREPTTGREYHARGAVAVSPERAARMILVGPGGTTALDLWVTSERFRFSVPAIKLERRGGRDSADARGLPVGMLRWWFLSPLSGRLLLARSSSTETSWILRHGVATVTLRTDGQRFVASRRDGDLEESIEWLSAGLVPKAGERGRYADGRSGLRVAVEVEEIMPDEPAEEAFADPDAQGDTSL